MVKLFHIAVLYKHPTKGVILKCASEVSSFSFFQRSSVVEFLKFSSQIIVSRSSAATRSSVREREYMCHVYVRSDCLAGVVVSDHEYPSRVLDDFASKIPAHTWSSLVESTCQYQGLEAYLAKYQVPTEADAMTKIQADLDETKIILHNTIEAVLERGEKLDDLVAKSEDLSMQSKTFYKTARKTNQCCTIL
ncbi:hypothetical protein HPB50_024959 [Hyalomma asiaticum]|uniref:Uncharacterized protein n=1 Tax=Hyalomma asiaticum TaxID=266040 RepID=A0ACB7TQA5_HYAAI|nr:hypothetical protein HPB50_024959 [Hyalomma asiaticum]